MQEKTTLLVKKKVSTWNRDININFIQLFKSISQGAIGYLTADTPKLVESLISSIDTFKIKDKPQVLAYLLISKSLQDAIIEIVNENIDKLDPEFKTIEKFEEYKEFQDLLVLVEKEIEKQNLEVDLNFFTSPSSISLMSPLIKLLKKWFQIFGFNAKEAKIASEKLKPYFIFSLHDNWRKNHESFKPILEILKTPFSEVTQMELEWMSYKSYLNKQTEAPVFNENFGLKDIFIPLNGYYHIEPEESEEGTVDKTVIRVDDLLKEWLNNCKNPEDSVKVICGGPGSGKSTMAKMFAAYAIRNLDVKVIYIPLQHLNIKQDLTISVGEYLREANFFQQNPLEEIHSYSSKLLIIFDGLDELSNQGKHAYELAKNFVEEVHRKTSIVNSSKIKLQIIITGRELTIQNQSSAFRRKKQIIHLLPYFNKYNSWFKDDQNLLGEDLRNKWWKNYGKLKGLSYKEFPHELRNPNLDEITAQPLLNYLVAITYERNKIKFDENTNLNEIFRDLIKAVFDRQYEKKQHKVISELKLDENSFFRILEEIAISAWHSGDIRTTTIQKIEEHIAANNLTSLFNEFQMGIQAGISRLLTAFYFRQKGIDNLQNKTFEFTHKSFGEYLASKRIVDFLILITKKIEKHDIDPDEGLNKKDALKKIIETLGVMPIDKYLFSFLTNEVQLFSKPQMEKVQNSCIKLLEYAINNGMPVELLSPRPSFETEQNYYRNSILSLFVAIKITSDFTGVKSDIDWPNEKAFGEIIGELRALKIPKAQKNIEHRKTQFLNVKDHNSLLNICLTNMIIKDSVLSSSDFTYSDFTNSEFRDVILAGSDCFGSHFVNCRFIRTNLFRVNLRHCVFIDVTFEGGRRYDELMDIEQIKESSILRNINGLEDKLQGEIDSEIKLRKKKEDDALEEIRKKNRKVEYNATTNID